MHSMHKCASVHSAITVLAGCDLPDDSTESCHVELGHSRKTRDFHDLRTVLEWFADHNPFDVSDSRLRSIATGVGADVQSSNVRAVRNSTDNTAADQLLAVHAISGCDTTSALFGHGKAGVYRKVVENPDTKPFTDVLSSVDASQTAVVEAITI